MSLNKAKVQSGFSLVELIVSMFIMLTIMGVVMTLYSRSLGTRTRESARTDALTAAQAALNVMSREIANSGYGVITNGLMNDSNRDQLHFVSNHVNTNASLIEPGENVTYFFEPRTQSILRHDANGTVNPDGTTSPQTSIIINRISSVQFRYFDYAGSSSVPNPIDGSDTPTANTGRVRITLTVNMENVLNQIQNHSVRLTSDVTLRNSQYMLKNY